MTSLTWSCLFSVRNSLTWNLSLILVLLISLYSPDICLAAVITGHPVSVTAPPFTTATFTCEGTGDILNWWIQSAPLTDSIEHQREITVTTGSTNDTNFSSVLTVNAIPNNDGLGIGCEIITLNPFNRVISNSVLTIRGISPVEDLNYNFTSNNSLLITWSPPVYYSNDIPIGSPVSYQVLVIDEEDEDIILDTNTTNTNCEVVNVTECDMFNISVTALLAQYISVDKSDSNNGSFGYNANITTNKDNFLTPNVTIELGCPPSKCSISLIITSDSEVIDQYNLTGTDEVVNDTRTLETSKVYNYTVRVFTLRDKFKYETYTIISTYQVIDVYINNTYTNGSVSVQCIYEELSTADGCHVIFTDTSNGTVLNVSLSLVQDPTLVALPAGNYTVKAYDIINGALYGPAVYYPTLVDVMKVILSTSTSSITAPTKSIVSNTVSPTVTVTNGTKSTSSTSGTIDSTNNVPIVAGILSGIVLLIILAVIGGIIVYKRKMMKSQVSIRSDIATIQKPQAETDQYQDVHELRNQVPIATSPVLLTSNRSIDEENPYHVKHTMDQMTQGPLLSLSSTTTRGISLEESISSTTSNNIHDNTYTTVPNANDTITVAVDDTDTTAPDNEVTDSTAAAMATVNDTAATVAPTYAVVAKRTDTTVLPAIAQRSEYGEITGHIDKRGVVTTYLPPVPPKAPPPTIDNDIHDEDDRCIPTNNNKEAPPPAYDDIVVPSECSHPQEEISDSTLGVSASVYLPPNGPTVNYPIIHNNIHLHVGVEGVEVKYGATSSSTSDYNSLPEVVVDPIQLPNKGPVVVEEDGDRCLVCIVDTLSTPPPSPCAAYFSNTGTPTTDTSTSKDHVLAELLIYLGKGESFNGIQQQNDYNHQRSILVVTCCAWKYRPDESSAAEDDNIEVTPIAVGDECGTKKVKKEGEVNSNDIEMFSVGLQVKVSYPIDSYVNVLLVGNPGACKTTLSHVINDTATGPIVCRKDKDQTFI